MTSVRRRIGRLLLTLAFCLFVVSSAHHARAQPPLPHEFYGALTIDGQPAPAGAVVEAQGEGVLTGAPDKGNPITTEEVGQYGGPSPFDAKLVVQGEDLRNGDAIAFYVDGVRAEAYDAEAGAWVDSYPFQSGMTTELDMRAAGATPGTTPSPTPRPTATRTPTSGPPSATATERAPTTSPEPTARPKDTPAPEATATSPPTAGPSPTSTLTSRPTTSPTSGPPPTRTPASTAAAGTPLPTAAAAGTTPERTAPATEGAEESATTAQPSVGGPAAPDVTPSVTSWSPPATDTSAAAEAGEGNGGPSILLIVAVVLVLIGGGAIAFGLGGLLGHDGES